MKKLSKIDQTVFFATTKIQKKISVNMGDN